MFFAQSGPQRFELKLRDHLVALMLVALLPALTFSAIPLVVLHGHTIATVDASLRSSFWVLVSAGLGSVVLGILVAGLIAQRISRSLRMLASATDELLAGRDIHIAPSPVAEVNALGRAMEQAGQKLQDVETECQFAKAAEQRFRTFVQDIDAIVWEATPIEGAAAAPNGGTRRFTFVSERVETLLGCPVERWLEEPAFWPSLIHPDDRDRVLAACRDNVAAGRDLQLDYRMIASDGRIVRVRDFVRAPRGARAARRGVIVDITALWEADRRRQVAEQQLAGLFAIAPEAIIVVDAEQRITLFNEGAAEIFGYQSGEVLGQPLDILLPRRFAAAHRDHVRAFGASREVSRRMGARGQVIGRRKDGSEFPAEASISKLVDPGGVAYCVILRDIGERQQAQEALRKSEERYRRLFENSHDGILVVARDGAVIDANPTCCAMLKYTREEMLGMSKEHLVVDPTARAEVRAGIDAVGFLRDHELQLRGKDGQTISVLATVTVVHADDGAVLGYQGFLRDVTAQKQAAAALEAILAERRQAQKMEAVGQLAGGIAHDFNNLLAVIKGRVEMALRRPTLSGEARRDIGLVSSAANRAAALTRQLLAFSRRQVLQRKVLDLNGVVTEISAMLRRLIGEQIDLVTRLDPALGRVKADPGQIDQVLVNLVVNARDAMPQGGRVTIETGNVDLDAEFAYRQAGVSTGRHVFLRVVDTGTGISPEILQQIFEPFFTTKAPGQGTGLGLATAYGIVRQHEGTITVDTAPGTGTTFTVYLQRTDAPAEPLEAEPVAAPRGGRSGTILLVEDEEDLRDVIREVLTEAGFTVLAAANGSVALEMDAQCTGTVDLVITDVVMPGMSGDELVDRLRRSRPELTVLYMSGHTGQAIAQDRLVTPGTAFIEKPFNPDGLVRKVDEMLGAFGGLRNRPPNERPQAP